MKSVETRFTVEFYEKVSGEKPCLEFLNTLEIKLRAKVFRYMALLEDKGKELRLPLVSARKRRRLRPKKLQGRKNTERIT